MNCSWRKVFVIGVVAACIARALPTLAAQCVGDCDGSGEVTVDELITGVNIALGTSALSSCPVFDANLDQMVTVDEIIAAVNSALLGCPVVSTPTPTRTPNATNPTPTTPPGCGNGTVDFNLGETCDDSNTIDDDGIGAVNPCPANCRIASCTSSGSTQTATVNFTPPAGVDVAGLTIFLRYPDGVVQIPGMASADQVQNRLLNLPDNAFSTPNDLDFALRVVLVSVDQSPFVPGTLLSVQFDTCRGAASPTADEFRCHVEDAADTNLNTITGVSCSVSLQ